MADEKLARMLEVAAEAMGGAAGAAIGLFLAGPAGAIAGGMAPSLAELALKSLLTDIANRELSVREKSRVGTAALHAMNRIYLRLVAGDKPREDGFFQSSSPHDRSPAEEAFEGVLMKCRFQWEEKKIPWVGNIYANAAMSDVPFAVVNRVITLSDRLTWRQLCVLALAGNHEELGANIQWMTNFPSGRNKVETVLIGEAQEMFQGQHGFLDAGPIHLSVIGQACFDLMSLQEFDVQDLEEIFAIFPRS